MTATSPTDRYFDSSDLRIHYLDWGNDGATPLILMHHNSSSARTWDAFAARVRDRYRVLAVDMRGHGDSQWAGPGRYTTEDHASDVIALMDHLSLAPAIVLGGSTGGRVALVTAGLAPERTAALVMEDVGAVRPVPIAQGFADRVAGGDPEFDTVEEWAATFQSQYHRVPAGVIEHLAHHNTRRLPNGKLGLKRDILIQRDFIALELWQYVEKVTAPFLILRGAESDIVGDDQVTRFREIHPDIEIVTVENAGHWIVHEQPEVFDATVLGFLARHGL